MGIRKFIKPSIMKLLTFMIISFFYLYIVAESICAVGFFFQFCYKAYGFPFPYLVTGDVDNSSGHIKTFFLGNHFAKFGSFMLNPITAAFDVILIYLLSCLVSTLLKGMRDSMRLKRKNT
ncbi:hypothetical protein HYS31_06415 [Candidatus Woesearchaeota archaeon]|nr:hypothetical protein [Candidatus Woesearchaeota archaeon]